MPLHTYHDFVLLADQVEQKEDQALHFTVQVFSAPVGEGKPIARVLSAQLCQLLDRLEERDLTSAEIMALGEMLTDLLLPAAARELFRRSLDRLETGQGLRLRLRLPPALADLPWEYLYLPADSTERTVTGFLALDPRISIVRHEALPLPTDLAMTPKQRRLLVVLASPQAPGIEPLKLAQERAYIEQALHSVAGIVPDFLDNATLPRLLEKLLPGVDIFHFAGHGAFAAMITPPLQASSAGRGALLLTAEDGSPVWVPADQLAVNLRNRGTQVVVLGACETGRRDGHNVWNSVATALLEVGIPAVVAMQYSIWDQSALAFSRAFYQGLAAGLLLDEALAAGRLAIFNLCHPLYDEPVYRTCWADWGVPVLYLRTQQSFALPAVASQPSPVTEVGQPLFVAKPGEPPSAEERILLEMVTKLRQRHLILFIGADLAASLTGLPGRQQLADALARQEGVAPGQALATVAQQVMVHSNRWNFTDFLIRTLEPGRLMPGPFYRTLARLLKAVQPEQVITTAYHRLLEVALQAEPPLAYYPVAQDSSLALSSPNRLTLLKLFGDIQQIESLIVTEQDQNALLRGRVKPALVDEVRRALRRSSVLFLGYNLSDPTVGALFDEVAGDRFQQRAYAVWPGLTPKQVESFHSNRGLMILAMEPVGLLEALLQRMGKHKAAVP